MKIYVQILIIFMSLSLPFADAQSTIPSESNKASESTVSHPWTSNTPNQKLLFSDTNNKDEYSSPPRIMADNPDDDYDDYDDYDDKAIKNIPDTIVTSSQAWDFHEIKLLALIIIAFTFLSLLLASIVLAKQKASPIHIFRMFIILTILGFASFLVVVGYSLEQINGVITLFSAIIGYLLGKDSSDKKSD